MAKFILMYHHSTRKPTDTGALQARWGAWLETHRTALIEVQNPLGPARRITAEGTSEPASATIMGYSVIECPDEEAALGIAQSCPYVEMGDLEIAPILEMGKT